jgi:AraC-like DNA-binding protein
LRVKVYKPKSKVLEKYIECFYTLKRSGSDEDLTYYGFPSNAVFLTICRKALIEVKQHELKISYLEGSALGSILIVDTESQAPCTYIGACDEITVYFKPLGINHFLPRPLNQYMDGPISFFEPYEDYKVAMEAVFQHEDEDQRIAQMEHYWLGKLLGFDHSFLNAAVREILQVSLYPVKVSQLAQGVGVSRVTLHKEFMKHLGTNPNQFIRIERFRNAVRHFTRNSTKEQLVDVAYLEEYFDQSHMAKDFRSLTGFSPKAFFSRLSQLESGIINWIFE